MNIQYRLACFVLYHCWDILAQSCSQQRKTIWWPDSECLSNFCPPNKGGRKLQEDNTAVHNGEYLTTASAFTTFIGCKWLHDGFQTYWELCSWFCVLHTWGTLHTLQCITLHYRIMTYYSMHTHTVHLKWFPSCCVSPEGCFRNTKRYSDTVPAQLDPSWGCRHVSAKKHIFTHGEARVWCDRCGGLVPTCRDAVAAEVLA